MGPRRSLVIFLSVLLSVSTAYFDRVSADGDVFGRQQEHVRAMAVNGSPTFGGI
jgi:hypothetical protein